MFIVINILALVTSILILLALSSKNDFWTRFLGEMYHAMGIALMAGAVIGAFISSNTEQFLLFFISGIVALILGVVLVLTSEFLLVKAQKQKTLQSPY